MSSSQTQGELWSEYASHWADLQERFHAPLFESMLNATIVGKNTKYLDIGCGSGLSSASAANRGAKVTGIDAASALIEIAKNREPSASFEVGDMENLPFDDESFDVVFAANAIQYASDRPKAMNELKRVCRNRGYITVGFFGEQETVDYRVVMKAVSSTLPEPPAGDGPFGLSSRERLEELFASANLEIMTHERVNCPMTFPDVDTFWLATRSGGPVVNVIQRVGEEKVKAAVRKASEPHMTVDGEVRFDQNYFQYLVAKKA